MRQISLALSTLGLMSLVLTGCPPTYPNCNNDEHCQERGEVCVQGSCKECATSDQCKEGFQCDANRCVPKAECSTDGDCGAEKMCQAGKCVAAQCTDDGQCGAGSTCQNKRCVARAEGTCASDADCPGGQACENGVCAAPQQQECNWDPVQFEFNQASLTSDAQSRLSSIADCVKAASRTVTLEGHADERGTEEYNLQLSNRRAASVKKYLVDLGVASNKLETVGYGENRPAESGSDEGAWAANRRVEFRR